MTVDIGRNARVLFDKEGYNFRGIHFTSSGNYLICAIPDEHLPKNASVMKISNNGNVEHEFTYFRGKPIFSRPYFVCENKTTKDICVSDIDEKVIGLTHFGDVCFKYEGNPSAVCRSPFSPRGIACDGHGNILVADVENDEVHLLNRKGEFVTHVLTSFNHISQPYGICVDSENRVWVVERNKNVGEVQTFAKIYSRSIKKIIQTTRYRFNIPKTGTDDQDRIKRITPQQTCLAITFVTSVIVQKWSIIILYKIIITFPYIVDMPFSHYYLCDRFVQCETAVVFCHTSGITTPM